MWTYETALTWAGGETGIERTANRPDLSVSSPPEFGGREDQWNPELLLVASVESCLLLTALSVAKRQKIELKGYSSKAVGRMAKTPEGLRFQEIAIAVTLTIDASTDAGAAARIVHTAEKYCPVSNALKCPVTVSVNVQTA
jgi:organic hydroperoxide reductase OsmC/OhrA